MLYFSKITKKCDTRKGKKSKNCEDLLYLFFVIYHVVHVSTERLRVHELPEAVNSLELALVHAYASADDHVFRYTSYFHALCKIKDN